MASGDYRTNSRLHRSRWNTALGIHSGHFTQVWAARTTWHLTLLLLCFRVDWSHRSCALCFVAVLLRSSATTLTITSTINGLLSSKQSLDELFFNNGSLMLVPDTAVWKLVMSSLYLVFFVVCSASLLYNLLWAPKQNPDYILVSWALVILTFVFVALCRAKSSLLVFFDWVWLGELLLSCFNIVKFVNIQLARCKAIPR